MYEYLLFWLQIYNKIMKRANKLSFLPLLLEIFVLARLLALSRCCITVYAQWGDRR